MNKDQIEKIILDYFKNKDPEIEFIFAFTLAELWKKNPGMEKAMEKIEKEEGFDKANEWLSLVLVKTGKYTWDPIEQMVEIKRINHE